MNLKANPDRMAELERHCLEALALPREQRAAYLDSACSDEAMRREVESLLAEQSDAGMLFRTVSGRPLDDTGLDLEDVGTVGVYEIQEKLGEGGMGVVFRARQSSPVTRDVALKIIHPEIASKQLVSRFLAERQALAMMDHPNIARVLDAGETSIGLPYLAMELVVGRTITEFCDERKLDVRERVELFIQVCEAIQHAHSKGIIHRDIKPSNVLVADYDGRALPKVIDFGIAKAMGPRPAGGVTNATHAGGLMLGTLEYMSPEQTEAGARDLDARSDVYSLGTLLYRLVCGRTPLDRRRVEQLSYGEILRLIREEVPPPASRVTRNGAIRKLDWILAKALEKDRSRRYQSAGAMGKDLRHYLDGEPLEAGPPSSSRSLRLPLLFSAVLAFALIAVLLSVRWFRISSSGIPAAPEIVATPLASLRGAERHPSVSPDGTRVAFAYTADNEANNHIYVKRILDDKLVRVTSGESADFQPVFSPDGTKLAFLRAANRRLRIMIVPAEGGIERQVAETTDLLREFPMIAWEPDGRNLLVCDHPSEFRPEVAIFEVSVETGARRQITFPPPGMSDWMPGVSPDGRRLGFARVLETGRGDLWAVSLRETAQPARGSERRLTNSNEVFVRWAWAAGGRELLISYRRSDRHQLWRQRVEGGRQTRVSGLDDEVRELSVAQNGKALVYGPGAQTDYNVWWYPLRPSIDTPRPLVASAAFDGDAQYSPDGSRIAFASSRSGQANIWICGSDGAEPRQITSLGAKGFWAGSPSWSPDGNWIAFDARLPGSESSVFVVNPAGGEPRRVTGPGPSDIIPRWSRDSQWIYFASDRGGRGQQIWKVSLAGGAPVQLTQNGGLEAFESPDGQFLYYTKRSRTGGFWRMPLKGGSEMPGGSETPVLGMESLGNRYWEQSPEGIYFVARSHQPVLQLFRFRTGAITSVMKLTVPPSLAYRGLSISPNGRNFLYLHPDVGRSNLMLVRNFQ